MDDKSNQHNTDFCLNITVCSEFPGIQSKNRNCLNKSSHYYQGETLQRKHFLCRGGFLYSEVVLIMKEEEYSFLKKVIDLGG